METKSTGEKIIFWGFVLLAISFIGMIIYFQYQNKQLNEKRTKLEEERITVQVQQAKVDAQKDEIEKLRNLVSKDEFSKVESIANQTDERIKNEIGQISNVNKIESIIYIQVGSLQTKSNLNKQNFISSLNSKGYNVINTFDLEDKKKVDNSIRYFNEEDKDLAEKLRQDIQKDFSINLTIKRIKLFKVKKGQIEIWIK